MNKIPLYKQIQQSIKEKITSGELRSGDRVPSEQEIMEAYRVSKITVKNALIALADEGLVIRIQGKGTFVSPNLLSSNANKPIAPQGPAGNFIGLVIPTMKTKVIQKLVDNIEYFLKEAGYQLLLHITRESSLEESRAIRNLTDAGVKGIIVFPTEDEKYSETLLRLSLDNYPFVFIDRFLRNIDTYQIVSDNFGGAYEMVSYLLNLGHRRIALISPENTNTTIEDRTLGFEKAYIDLGISIDKSLWCHVPLHILRTKDSLPYITDFLEKHPQISAAFTLTAEMANMTCLALKQADSVLAGDLKLVSFDDPEIPNVPYIIQDEKRMSQSAVDLLISQIEGEYFPKQIIIPVNLVFSEDASTMKDVRIRA
ncbi:GntR family transcriptional regulator [Paenibacillus sp. V4I5]|uniref:GntR family transcriptional regulator n=1 Tax=Paenibacillus sp. V4I5 TaxID=3042306 RepID=UPI0027922792|nr:GntR family transcriptional regulator [Paenibacillus sp. V4I5]MDQ0917029.1 GntR family transcriptional regulator of arabinose operon [Paenibacillus sp. V4I5]